MKNPIPVKQLLITGVFYSVLLLTTLVYWPGLNGDLILDDIENLKPLAELDNANAHLSDIIFNNESGILGRPVSMFTFVVNYLSSGNDIWALKYTNLMIHLLCGSLLLWLTGRLLLHSNLKEKRWEIALLATSLWLLSPMLTTTTLYTIQRMAQLSCLFILCGLISYTIFRPKLEQNIIKNLTILIALISIFSLLSALSKENGILLPFFLFIIELFVFRFSASPRVRRIIISLFILICAIPLLAFLVYLAINPDFITKGYSYRSFTLYERLITEPRVLVDYARNLIIPDTAKLGVFHDDYQHSTSLASPITTLPSIVFLISIMIATIASLKKRHHIIFFGIAFFLLGHSLESSIFSLELYFEHRNYTPSIGIYISLSILLILLTEKLKSHVLVVMCLTLLPASFAIASYQKSQTWSSWETTISTSIVTHPRSMRAHTEVATMLATSDPIAAINHLDIIKSIAPNEWAGLALHKLVVLCLSNSEIRDTDYDLLSNKPLTSNTAYQTNVLRILRELATTNNCPQLNLTRLTEAVSRWAASPNDALSASTIWHINLELGMLYAMIGDLSQSTLHLDKAFQARRDTLEPLLLKAKFEIEAGQFGHARITILQAKTIKTNRQDYKSTIAAVESLLNTINSPQMNNNLNSKNGIYLPKEQPYPIGAP
jgi:hypothetical protein